MAERLVLGDEEAAADEPRADGPSAVEEEQHDRGRRIDAQADATRRSAVDRRVAAAQQHSEREGEQRAADRPGFVARHARRRQREPRPAPRSVQRRRPRRPRRSSVADQRDREQRRPEEQRFGHRRALQVEHVRVGEEQRRARGAAGDRAGAADDERRQRPCRRPPCEAPRWRCADAPLRYHASTCTGSMLSTCGSGSHTAPICCQPGIRLSRIRRATTRCARAS